MSAVVKYEKSDDHWIIVCSACAGETPAASRDNARATAKAHRQAHEKLERLEAAYAILEA